MANKESSYIAYFKIRWAKRSAWTLEQAAYLSCGKNPDTDIFQIAVTASNPVSKRYHWLRNKFLQGRLNVVGVADGVEYFNTGSVLRLLEQQSQFVVDPELRKTLDHMYRAPFGIDHTKFISRAVYREAGRLIFQQYPSATKSQVAKVLEELPKFFNNEEHGHIETLGAHQIEEHLKGLNNLSGKPKSADKVEALINLKELTENM
jgi:hypothetical protein